MGHYPALIHHVNFQSVFRTASPGSFRRHPVSAFLFHWLGTVDLFCERTLSSVEQFGGQLEPHKESLFPSYGDPSCKSVIGSCGLRAGVHLTALDDLLLRT